MSSMYSGDEREKGNFLFFVLSVWDDVVGPRVVKRWDSKSDFSSLSSNISCKETRKATSDGNCVNGLVARNPFPENCDESARYIATHTVIGELWKESEIHFDAIRETCLVVPALGFLAQSAVFSTVPNSFNNDTEPSIYSFSIAVTYNCREYFWNLQPLLVHQTTKIASYLKISLSQDPRENLKFTQLINEADGQIFATFQSSLKSSIDYLAAKSYFRKFAVPWAVAISAMLTTGGCCTVVGRFSNVVNKVVDFLSLFLPEKEMQKNSRHVCENVAFCTGLFLQGLLEDDQGKRNITSCDVFLNDLPLTVVDLSRKGQVLVSCNIYEHRIRKERQLRQEEVNIIDGTDIQLPHTTESLFRPYREPSRFVVWCLEQLSTQNVQKWDRIIHSFHRALLCKAANLLDSIKELQPQYCGQLKRREKLATRLRKSLSITESDFWLLTAVAERIQPGISNIFAHV